MLAYMKRTSVKVPDELDARLRNEAERRGKTVSEITREALESYLGARSNGRLSFAGVGASGRQDISERIEEILAGEARQ
jgi:metal-responsive CopG/Arc/MetJ family transcriptional regulator